MNCSCHWCQNQSSLQNVYSQSQTTSSQLAQQQMNQYQSLQSIQSLYNQQQQAHNALQQQWLTSSGVINYWPGYPPPIYPILELKRSKFYGRDVLWCHLDDTYKFKVLEIR